MSKWEFLVLPDTSVKGSRGVKELSKHAKDKAMTEQYQGDSEWLVLQGIGGSRQGKIAAEHIGKGGKVLAIDFGYWGKEAATIRISINTNHPDALLQYADGVRNNFVPPPEEDLYNPKGHIIVAGLGPKSRTLYGFNDFEWEEARIAECRALYPDRKIWYRPKPNHSYETIPGTINGSVGPIVNALTGCSMCVVYHSNVAVDCAQYGIPCVAYEGVGRYVYPSDIAKPKKLTSAEREDFFQRLNWFNWKPSEFHDLLPFVEQLGAKVK